MRVPLPTRNQKQGQDQGATEHFVRRFARAAPPPRFAAFAPPYVTRLETAPTG
jgi:hypothetical protein